MFKVNNEDIRKTSLSNTLKKKDSVNKYLYQIIVNHDKYNQKYENIIKI